jgi:threonyl-tRNA synthetase
MFIFSLITTMADQLYCIRHSLSHILAQALQRTIDSNVQLGTGPAIDEGFYYDVQFSTKAKKAQAENDETMEFSFGEGDLKELEKVMQGIVKEGQ